MSRVDILKLAIGLFVVALVLSLLSLKYKKPEGKWFSPVWKMRENYEKPGIVLYAVSVGLMVIGFGLYLSAR